jgi:hypothetical protein
LIPSLIARPRLACGVAAVLVAAIVATLAIVDHRRVRQRSHRADVAGWFCEYKRMHCDELQPDTLESRWEVRERSYEAAFGVAVVVAATAAASAVRRRSV